METAPTAWKHFDRDGSPVAALTMPREEVEVWHRDGDVLLEVSDSSQESAMARIDPREACVLAHELVRAAGRANGKGDPVSVYMPTDMWEALIELAEEGGANGAGTGAASEALKVLKAVVRGVPSEGL